jgi:antitoxin YobK
MVEAARGRLQEAAMSKAIMWTTEAVAAARDVRAAIDLLRSRQEADTSGGVPDSVIHKAEERLGLEFPESFRIYLREVGQVIIGGTIVYGLWDDRFDEHTAPCAVWVTLDHRRFGMPDSYVVVYALGEGTVLAIDTASPGSPIVAWRHWSPSEVEEEYASFGHFLFEIVEEEIDRLEAEATAMPE